MKSSCIVLFLFLITGVCQVSISQTKYAPSSDIEQLFEDAEDLSALPEGDCDKSYLMGIRDGGMKAQAGLGLGSAGLGCLAGACGPSILAMTAANNNNAPTLIPEGVDEDCYRHGYELAKTQKKHKAIAIGGIVIGSIAIILQVVIYASLSASF